MLRARFWGTAGAPANPTVALSPSQSQWVQAGTAVTYTVSVTNYDNGGCAPATFALQAAAPAGWTVAFNAATLTLSPGAAGSVTMTVTSPTTAIDGFYTIGVTATNSGASAYTASTAATYVVVTSLNVTVSTDKASYSRNQSVTITTVVTANGSPVAGAAVTVTVTKPGGKRATGTATTGANGAAVYQYRISRKDPVGTYGIGANANLNNAIFGSGSWSFTVQ